MTIFNTPPTSLLTGNTAVASAGTRVQLTTTKTPCAWVVVTAAPANAGNIVVGDVNVVATSDAERGVTLDGGDSITIPIADVSSVYIDADTSGDEVGYLAGVYLT